MNAIIKSKGFKIAALAVAFILVALLSFAGGIKIGSRKALYSSDWGRNYERNFMHPPFQSDRFPREAPREFMDNMMRDFSGRDFRNGHGLVGTIIFISDKTIVVKDKDGKENTVAITDKTIIKMGPDSLNLGDLKQDDQIVVIGQPDSSGVVNADLIRVFPTNINNTQNN